MVPSPNSTKKKSSISALRPLNHYVCGESAYILAQLSNMGLFSNCGFLFVVGFSTNCCIHSVSRPSHSTLQLVQSWHRALFGEDSRLQRQIYRRSIFVSFYYDLSLFLQCLGDILHRIIQGLKKLEDRVWQTGPNMLNFCSDGCDNNCHLCVNVIYTYYFCMSITFQLGPSGPLQVLVDWKRAGSSNSLQSYSKNDLYN